MKKKVIALIAVAALSVSALTGCGSNETAAQTSEAAATTANQETAAQTTEVQYLMQRSWRQQSLC